MRISWGVVAFATGLFLVAASFSIMVGSPTVLRSALSPRSTTADGVARYESRQVRLPAGKLLITLSMQLPNMMNPLERHPFTLACEPDPGLLATGSLAPSGSRSGRVRRRFSRGVAFELSKDVECKLSIEVEGLKKPATLWVTVEKVPLDYRYLLVLGVTLIAAAVAANPDIRRLLASTKRSRFRY